MYQVGAHNVMTDMMARYRGAPTRATQQEACTVG